MLRLCSCWVSGCSSWSDGVLLLFLDSFVQFGVLVFGKMYFFSIFVLLCYFLWVSSCVPTFCTIMAAFVTYAAPSSYFEYFIGSVLVQWFDLDLMHHFEKCTVFTISVCLFFVYYWCNFLSITPSCLCVVLIIFVLGIIPLLT